jgi:hypothetical protein
VQLWCKNGAILVQLWCKYWPRHENAPAKLGPDLLRLAHFNKEIELRQTEPNSAILGHDEQLGRVVRQSLSKTEQ